MEIYILAGLIVVCFVILTIPYMGSKHLTGPATVVSKQVEYGRFAGKHSSSWNYLVTFRLCDGEEIQLYTFENQYKMLKEGTSGMLTWSREHFVSFELDKEE